MQLCGGATFFLTLRDPPTSGALTSDGERESGCGALGKRPESEMQMVSSAVNP